MFGSACAFALNNDEATKATDNNSFFIDKKVVPCKAHYKAIKKVLLLNTQQKSVDSHLHLLSAFGRRKPMMANK